MQKRDEVIKRKLCWSLNVLPWQTSTKTCDTREVHKYTFDYSNSWGTWGQNSFCLIGVRQDINKYKKKTYSLKRIPVFRCHFDLCWWMDGCRRELERRSIRKQQACRLDLLLVSSLQSFCSGFCLTPRLSLSLSASPAPPRPVHAHTCATRGHGRSPTPLWC